MSRAYIPKPNIRTFSYSTPQPVVIPDVIWLTYDQAGIIYDQATLTYDGVYTQKMDKAPNGKSSTSKPTISSINTYL